MTANPKLERIRAILQGELSRLCEEYHVATLPVFRSVVRGDNRPDSDVDGLVTFDRVPELFR